MRSLVGRSLLTLKDYSSDEIGYLLDLATHLKAEGLKRPRRFAGLNLAMIFEKRSTRTRCAFETAFGEDGGHPVFLSPQDVHLGEKESVEDTARVLGRMFDAIEFRGYKQEVVETLAQSSGVPVYNGLTDDFHPTQALADLLTLRESFGTLSGRKIAYLGDGRNNVAHSLLVASAKMGVSIFIVSPAELRPDESLVEECRGFARDGAEILIGDEIKNMVAGADALYTDVWVSMGEERKLKQRVALLEPFRVTEELMTATGRQDSIFLHCLPAVKGNEVTVDVFESSQSRVFDQAENRKHTIKAVMAATLGAESLQNA